MNLLLSEAFSLIIPNCFSDAISERFQTHKIDPYDVTVKFLKMPGGSSSQSGVNSQVDFFNLLVNQPYEVQTLNIVSGTRKGERHLF